MFFIKKWFDSDSVNIDSYVRDPLENKNENLTNIDEKQNFATGSDLESNIRQVDDDDDDDDEQEEIESPNDRMEMPIEDSTDEEEEYEKEEGEEYEKEEGEEYEDEFDAQDHLSGIRHLQKLINSNLREEKSIISSQTEIMSKKLISDSRLAIVTSVMNGIQKPNKNLSNRNPDFFYDSESDLHIITMPPFSVDIVQFVEEMNSIITDSKAPWKIFHWASQEKERNEINELLNKKEDVLIDDSSETPEQRIDRRRRALCDSLLPEYKKLEQVQKVYFDICDEFSLSDRLFIDKNFYEMCRFIRHNQPCIELLTNRFILVEKCDKLVQLTSFKLPISKSKSTIMSNEDVIEFLWSEIPSVYRELTKYEDIWIEEVIFDDKNQCNFTEQFQISFTCSKNWLNCQPMAEENDKSETIPKEKEISLDITKGATSSDDNKNWRYPITVFSSGSLIPGGSEFCYEIRRNQLWALYVANTSRGELCDKVVKCHGSQAGYILWSRNLRTYIIMQTLFESGELIPKNIHDIVVNALRNSTYTTFKMKKTDLDLLLDFVEPFLVTHNILNTKLAIRLMNGECWKSIKTINDSTCIEFDLSLNIKFRSFRKKVQPTLERIDDRNPVSYVTSESTKMHGNSEQTTIPLLGHSSSILGQVNDIINYVGAGNSKKD